MKYVSGRIVCGIVSSETSAIRTQTPGNYPKRNKLHLEHGESLKTTMHFVHTVCLCVPYGSHKKQRLFFLYGIHRLFFITEARTERL